MSVSSSVYSFRMPGPGGQWHSHGASIAAAIEQPAPSLGAENVAQPMDVVILWGPEQPRENLEAISAAAAHAGLAFRVIETAGDHAQQNDVVRELYLSNELGPHTQLVACFASANGESVQVAEGGGAISALDLICWFRTPPMTDRGPLRPSWKGTIHAFWQQSGRMLDYYDPDRPLWETGPAITHVARKGGTEHNCVAEIEDLCAYIGSVRGQAALLAPAYIAARMLGVTGDTLACAGGRFKRAVVAGAPRTPAQAQHDHLIASLEGGNGDQARFRGARSDLRELACAMRHPAVRGKHAQRQATKLENVFVTRAERCKLPAMDELVAQYPSLLRMRACSGRSGAQIYKRVLHSVTIIREMAILDGRQGDETNLNRLLDSIAGLRSQGLRFSLNLADLLRNQVQLLAAGLRWTAIHDDESLFLHLLQAVQPADQPALLEKSLATALQCSPSLAIGILGLRYPDGTLAQLVDLGIRKGASEPVIFAWLSQLDWMAAHGAASLVLASLCDTARFPRLPVLLAERCPAVFDALLAVMRQDKDRHSSYAEGLLAYAQENQDASLFGKLARGYFLTGRWVAATSAEPATNAVDAAGSDSRG